MGSLCIFANTPKNTYLKSEQQTAKMIILMTVLKTK